MENSIELDDISNDKNEDFGEDPLLKAKIQGIHFLSAFLKIWLCVSDFVPLNFAKDCVWAQANNKTNNLSLLYIIDSADILEYDIPDWVLPLKETKCKKKIKIKLKM